MHYFVCFILTEGFVATSVDIDPWEYTSKVAKEKKKKKEIMYFLKNRFKPTRQASSDQILNKIFFCKLFISPA